MRALSTAALVVLAGLSLPSARAQDGVGATTSRTAPDAPPRKVYNAALEALGKHDLEAAEKGFADARDRAGPDHDLRFRSAFDLAFTLAARAEGLEKEKPEDAVTTLRTAAAWFRDAIREEPGDHDARANLEVVLRRLQALADALEKKAGTLEAKLDRLIEDQRSLRDEARGLVEKIDAAGASTEPVAFQDPFRSLATWQRVLVSDTGALVTRAGDELGHLESRPEAERKDEDRLRLGQLQGLVAFLDRARQRMADARRLFQKLQGDAGHRAADASLRELARAKEQLQDPGALLRALVADEAHVFEQTGALQAGKKAELSVTKEASRAPAWLTSVYLGERQDDVSERTGELAQRFEGGLAHAGKADPNPGALRPSDTAPVSSERRMKRTLDAVKEALPHVQEAARAMGEAKTALAGEHLDAAATAELRALESLGRALERLSGIKALVELAFAEETRVVGLLSPPAPGAKPAPELPTEERARLVRAAVARNRERLSRLALLFQDEVAAIDEKSREKKDEKAEAEKQRYTLAERERSAAAAAVERLARAPGVAEEGQLHDPGPLAPPLPSAQEALAHLENLRRLFFSLVEHLEDLLREEARARDETASAGARKDPAERQRAFAPLADGESRRATLARTLAEALEKQAAAAPPGQAKPGSEKPNPAHEAGVETKAAGDSMEHARDALGGAAPRGDDALKAEKEACEHLARAIALLKPPGENQDQQENQGEKKKGEEQEAQVSREQAARRLQSVRDREASRAAQRERGTKAAPEPVEKDW
jgi:hypothetical protein